MSSENLVEKLAAQLGQTATVKNVYGEPVRVGDKTIIPVAQVAYGCGGGYGQCRKPKQLLNETPVAPDANPAEGAGGGGGMFAKPKGIYEITPTSTRFIPASGAKILATGVLIGFVAYRLFGRKRK
ncbi:MAG TPA: spore germination protein GerW family protein [Puia sp.]|nr:spore germination protein GerW family protein [Puia sp.]